MRSLLSVRPLSLLKFMALGMVASLSAAAQAAPVAEVVFVIGEARLEGGNAPLAKGSSVEAGQTIVTGQSGHVHLRFIDQAFVSVRPDSVLTIEQYAYDPAQPANNRVKFHLQQGTSRLISGKASEAAKQNFRINTPVAAIGVRGTDFHVQTDANTTRASVQQGAIVVSPLGEGCSAQALGPCQGAFAVDLAGSLTGKYLEVQPKMAPVLKMQEGSGQRPFGLPQPSEPKVNTSNGAGNSAHFAENMKEGNTLLWGRWSGSAPVGYEVVGHLDTMALYRQQAVLDLPHSGEVKFKPVEVMAYARAENGSLTAATITNPELSINFETSRYSTKFNWSSGGQTLALHNNGRITEIGRFHGQRTTSNVTISGGLTANGDEAAYLFLKNQAGADPYGLIRWTK